MKNRRGQAALEFLSTYGFAFLIILVMVGALTYFGVLNPSGLVPNKCLGGNGITCEEAQFVAVGTPVTSVQINLALKNDRGTTTTLGFPVAAGTTTLSMPGYGAGMVTPVANCAAVGTIPCAGYAASSTALAAAFPTAATISTGPGITSYMRYNYAAAGLPSRNEKLKAIATITYTDSGAAFGQTQSIDLTQTLS